MTPTRDQKIINQSIRTNQVITTMTIKLFKLEDKVEELEEQVSFETRGKLEYSDILQQISTIIGYSGNYHNLPGLIKEKI